MLKDLSEVSRKRKWINLLLPQRLMENIRALLSITHCIKDVAKLLNKVTQLWEIFDLCSIKFFHLQWPVKPCKWSQPN